MHLTFTAQNTVPVEQNTFHVLFWILFYFLPFFSNAFFCLVNTILVMWQSSKTALRLNCFSLGGRDNRQPSSRQQSWQSKKSSRNKMSTSLDCYGNPFLLRECQNTTVFQNTAGVSEIWPKCPTAAFPLLTWWGNIRLWEQTVLPERLVHIKTWGEGGDIIYLNCFQLRY